MLSTFIAILGGLFWLCKFGHERLQAKEADNRVAKLRAQYERWRNSVRDDWLNKYTLDMVNTKDGFLKLQEEAIEVIRQLPGMEHAEMQCVLSDAARGAVRFIVMVKRGKLPHGSCNQIPMSIWQCTDISFSKRAMVAFARWAESTMQANGHSEARLYYSKKLSGAVNKYEKNAVFQWEAALISFDGVFSVSDQCIEQIMTGA